MINKRVKRKTKSLKNMIFKTGDNVSFTLNLKEATFICNINNNLTFLLRKGIEKDENIKWKMIISLKDIGDSVSILNCYQHQ